MSVVTAKIQTVEDMYRLIWTAIANRQPIAAVLWRRERERIGADRVAGELALRRFRETAPGGTGERFLEDRPKSFPSSDLRGNR